MQMKTLMMKMLLAIILFVPAFVGSVADDGSRFALSQAQAADATIRVDVIKATKEGSGADKRSARFKSVLDQMGQYKGFTYIDGGGITAPLGESASLKLGGRTVTAALKSLGADKSETEVTITGSGGETHRTTLKLRNGATHVWAIKRGDSADLVIVKVSY
jgi:predicted amino acid dehydrogenase